MDDDGETIGTAPKATVHTRDTALHLAFSCHVFDAEGRILVTRRAIGKLTWPGVWTNSFCGHPAPDEDMVEAVHRRAEQEARADPRVGRDSCCRTSATARPTRRASSRTRSARCSAPWRPRRWIRGPRRSASTSGWIPRSLIPAVAHTPWAFSPWLTLQLPLLYPEHAAHAGSRTRRPCRPSEICCTLCIPSRRADSDD
ncbi:isopentenyl-diphosphate Delta-isomerase [Clavibacter tessellarius]|uniref:isopentenyl-diphosphate Delta-isomerase n=1 Tax=Clavibacter tessellarius TaxID=31965 RepID=UPI0039BF0B48